MNKRGVEHFTHNAAVMSFIGNVPNIALDFEMYKAKNNTNEKRRRRVYSGIEVTKQGCFRTFRNNRYSRIRCISMQFQFLLKNVKNLGLMQ